MNFTLSTLYKCLRKKGYKEQEEHIVIEGIPVQFIPAYNELLLDEAQIDMPYLENVLERHGLQEKWSKFRRRYSEE